MKKERIRIEVFHEIFVTVFYLLRLNRSLALAAWQDYNAVNRDNGTDGISSLFLHSPWKWPQFSPAFQTHIRRHSSVFNIQLPKIILRPLWFLARVAKALIVVFFRQLSPKYLHFLSFLIPQAQ